MTYGLLVDGELLTCDNNDEDDDEYLAHGDKTAITMLAYSLNPMA